jgi:hypothetical protein
MAENPRLIAGHPAPYHWPVHQAEHDTHAGNCQCWLGDAINIPMMMVIHVRSPVSVPLGRSSSERKACESDELRELV